MAITITITSTKGGVGKTTLAANLGGFLADLHQRVLLVDADVQPTLSSYYPIDQRADGGLMALLTEGRTRDVISRTEYQGLDIVVSDDPQGHLQNFVLHAPDGRVRLKHLLARLDDEYDFILVDTQGAVGPLQDASVLAADLLLSPIPPEILSAREFARGTLEMLDRLRPMASLGAPVGPLRGLLYRVDRTVDARRICAEFRGQTFGPGDGSVSVLDSGIPSTVAYREAATAREPIHRWEKRRTGPTASGLVAMLTLAYELFPDVVEAAGLGPDDVVLVVDTLR